MMAARKSISPTVEAGVLLRCRRRCAICYGIDRIHDVRRGQIAHLDREASNNDPDNLTFLCLEHHELYDTVSRQAKGLTAVEVKVFRAELEEAMAVALATPLVLQEDTEISKDWSGTYRWHTHNGSAELAITLAGAEYIVRGVAFCGIDRSSGPNIGQVDGQGMTYGERLVIRQDDYELVLTRSSAHELVADETGPSGAFGAGVQFAGTYLKVPEGADVLPQPSRRTFESEFWPEEGRPVFEALGQTIALRSRPDPSAPIVELITAPEGERMEFTGFRYRTLRPGVLVATRQLILTGRNLGAVDYVSRSHYYHDGGEVLTIILGAGEYIEYLQYRAEGTGFLRWQGLVLDTDLAAIGAADGYLPFVTQPVTQRWVQLAGGTGGRGGWTEIEDVLREVDRTF
jgi:hypothetical protein